MPKFNVTIIKVEARTIKIVVEAESSFDAVRLATKAAEKVPETEWSKDYERSYNDYSTQWLDEV